MFRRKGKKSKLREVQYLRVILKPGVWKRVPMKLLKWGRKMASTKRYDLVPDDEYDTRIPLHPEVAFEYGINFHAKYIGTMDVPRPTSRVEIVAAMRRVRYEFKAKGCKKRQVTLGISVNGVRVTTLTNVSNQKRPRFFSRKKKTTECIEIMNHPIYRIFYVSHDSSDLKIFSYIARDGATNAFKCNVFKSNKKSQAMKIVRTVGQAFEVCHKMQENTQDNPVPSTSSAPDDVVTVEHVREAPASREPASDCGASGSGGASSSKTADEPRGAQNRNKHIDPLPPPPRKEGKRSAQVSKPVPSINLPDLPECVTKVEATNPPEGDATTPLSAQHQMQLLQERLDQQSQQTRAAVAQLLLFRDQLAAEQAARCEAQARTHQLLVHNKELLEHIAALVAHLQEKEKGVHRPMNAEQLTLLPQIQPGGTEAVKTDNATVSNGNRQPFNSDDLINFFSQNNKMNQNVENNNTNPSNNNLTANATDKPNGSSATPNFGTMNNEQMQNYLISKFQEMTVANVVATDKKPSGNQYFFQNSKAFPNIPPLINHYSDSELASLLSQQGYPDKFSSSDELGNMAQAMSIGHSQNSLYSSSSDSSDSSTSDEILPYIMPLSHNGTLTATGEDGRVRVIVPVSPSPSTSGVGEPPAEVKQTPAGATLKVPGAEAPTAPITRSTSEKVPNRSEMMAALRSQWTRHTTK